MLQIKQITKKYQTGSLVQVALDKVELNLRESEFVAILGPSGSGKTTLLNIIGGLDRYDCGDLVINSISTKKYTDRDWDSYRNHTIGFIFQSYNLIPHQSIQANVELALTISGITRSERKRRAKEALDQVGLAGQYHKKPTQMSGGQMQRVAIARALINNPDILLADEPTGALDTETSKQVMELLKEVAKERLVVMVTHNPELAQEYASRIIKLRDGKIIDDSDPFVVDDTKLKEAKHKNMGKASMSYLTSLSLSFNNLRTKKGRTFLTAFAGSIGIIGIALILSLSSGVNNYINDIQKSTMTSYPITIEEQSMDLSSILATGRENVEGKKNDHELDGIYVNSMDLELQSTMITSLTENNLTDFKKYLDNSESEIHEFVGENGIVYSYDTTFSVYTYDDENVLVNTDGSTLESNTTTIGGPPPIIASMVGTMNNFEQLMPGVNGEVISPAISENYEVVYGQWPTEYNEVVVVLDSNHEIASTHLYELGLLPSSEYKEIQEKMEADEEVSINTEKLSYEKILDKSFYLVIGSDTYVKNDAGLYDVLAPNSPEVEALFDEAVELKVSGIIRPNEDAEYTPLMQVMAYTQELTDYIIDSTNNSSVVKDQQANPDINVISGVAFEPEDDAAKIEDTKTYISTLGVTDKADLFRSMLSQIYSNDPTASMQLMMMGENELVMMFDQYLLDPEDDVILSIYDRYISSGNYNENMEAFGVVSLDAPSSINIYTDSFESKDSITLSIENYNESVDEEDKIVYNDAVALLMSSVTTIINVISYVLIAFVAVSLIVSSIMIGIITFISVLERTKEIGILRAIGASKRNITQVFNAETFIIGLLSGLIGIGSTLLLLYPINAIIHAITKIDDVSAALPWQSASILVILSVILTLIGGLIPSKKAAKKDPVTALRTE